MAKYFEAGANPPPLTSQAILEAKSGKIIAQITYDDDLIQDLKRCIPYEAREWDDRQKRWIIEEAYADTLDDLLVEHDFSVEDLRRRPLVWYAISWCLRGGGFAGIIMYEAASKEEALKLKKEIDERNCGGQCMRAHTVEKRNRLKGGYHYKRWNPFQRCYDRIICDWERK
jgi:hypothetical protein